MKRVKRAKKLARTVFRILLVGLVIGLVGRETDPELTKRLAIIALVVIGAICALWMLARIVRWVGGAR